MGSAKNSDQEEECVILLHGLVRSSDSMDKIEQRLLAEGYQTVNYDYPSRDYTIEELANHNIPEALRRCDQPQTRKIHFVTHSLGGILVRYYLQQHTIENLGRVVMLSPPNQGSEAVDELADLPGFELLNGPAGEQLGTDDNGLPAQLGPADFEVGIITGDHSVNLVLSQLIPGEDDGKVSIKNARLEGMKDFLVVPHSHTFIMRSDAVIDQIIFFLKNGIFDRSGNSSE